MPTQTEPLQSTGNDAGGKQLYDRKFFDAIRSGSRRSAAVIAPIVLELTGANSIVDVGCGDGSWLATFREIGIEDILGLDGDYIDHHQLQIPWDQFRPVDLSRPFTVERNFDLAVSLEVAEHIPEKSAKDFVLSLTRLAPVVLFSAAVPFQGGTGHLNEQWPEYWAALFGRSGFVPIDCIREHIWNDDDVEFWYAQNCLIFADRNVLRPDSALGGAFERTNPNRLVKIHPLGYMRATLPLRQGVNAAWPLFTKAFRKAVSNRVRSFLPFVQPST